MKDRDVRGDGDQASKRASEAGQQRQLASSRLADNQPYLSAWEYKIQVYWIR